MDTAVALLLLGPGMAIASAAPPPIEARLRARLLAFRGLMGVAAKSLTSGEVVAVNGDTRFPTASVIKLALMVEAFQQIADGRLSADREVVLPETAKVGGSGVLRRMHAGLRLSVADLVDLTITVSDNTATNLLLERVGVERVNARLAALGLANTLLFRPTFRDGRADVRPDLEAEFGLGMSTPRDMVRLLEEIARGEAVNAAASAEMKRILGAQLFEDMIPRGLPEGVQAFHKTGSDEEKLPGRDGRRRQLHADVGIVEGPGARFVLAIFARQVEDPRWGVDNEALVTGGEVARMLYEHFAGTGTGGRAGAP